MVRVEILSRHLPLAQGTAAGRVLLATGEGLVAEGVDLQVTSWSPEEPAGSLPAWCAWTPLPPESALRRRSRALVRPRADVVLLDWSPVGVAVADDPLSVPALPVGGMATLHYATALDVRRPTPHDLQDLRAERRLRRTTPVLAYSSRVAAWARGTAIPAAIRIPPDALPPVEAPIAALVADWRWAPNRRALEHLLTAWRSVHVPGARLLLAGRGGERVQAPGVQWLGAVHEVEEVLSQAAVLAFPCPDTSGPKVKVLEAAAAGLAVLTTASGAEGIATDGVETSSLEGFGAALQALLADPARRVSQAAVARRDVAAVHGPVPAARARLEATERLGRHQQGEQQRHQPG